MAKQYLVSELTKNRKLLGVMGVYKITNTINGKFYIGSSNNIYNRWRAFC